MLTDDDLSLGLRFLLLNNFRLFHLPFYVYLKRALGDQVLRLKVKNSTIFRNRLFVLFLQKNDFFPLLSDLTVLDMRDAVFYRGNKLLLVIAHSDFKCRLDDVVSELVLD